MKKHAFGIIAALFALMIMSYVCMYAEAIIIPYPEFTPTPDNDVYIILYEDGTLVFQNDDKLESGRVVKQTYLAGSSLWHFDKVREFIRVVEFADIVSPTSTRALFCGCSKLQQVNKLYNLDTSNITDMSYMFEGCRNLTVLDVSSFDTAKVTDMTYMFEGCSGLTALDVSNFNTANVTSMSCMFANCSGLTALDVSHFNTANVTSMVAMFSGCSNLTALNVSNFNTANVTEMHEMFSTCKKLTALNVSNFDTANVTSMHYMFRNCSGLTALDVSHFDTANVTSMSVMFSGCSGLETLDISNFHTANVETMWRMFEGCSNLKTIYVSEKFTTMPLNSGLSGEGLFAGCKSLIGDSGTKYDESHTDKEYARIDTLDAPGYFTYKAAPAPAYAIDALRIVKNGEDARTLYVTLTVPSSATLSVVYFDENGKFISVELVNVTPDDGTQSFEIAANTKTLLATLLDGDCRTLCEPFSVGL